MHSLIYLSLILYITPHFSPLHRHHYEESSWRVIVVKNVAVSTVISTIEGNGVVRRGIGKRRGKGIGQSVVGIENFCWEFPRGQHQEDLTQWELSQNPHKEMTPPSTQNLKALGLWVFFLICCSTISFLLNVGLKLTLGYLTISPSSESPFHIGTLSLKHEYLTNSSLVLRVSSTLVHSPQTRVPHKLLTCTVVHTFILDTLAWNLRQ